MDFFLVLNIEEKLIFSLTEQNYFVDHLENMQSKPMTASQLLQATFNASAINQHSMNNIEGHGE